MLQFINMGTTNCNSSNRTQEKTPLVKTIRQITLFFIDLFLDRLRISSDVSPLENRKGAFTRSL